VAIPDLGRRTRYLNNLPGGTIRGVKFKLLFRSDRYREMRNLVSNQRDPVHLVFAGHAVGAVLKTPPN